MDREVQTREITPQSLKDLSHMRTTNYVNKTDYSLCSLTVWLSTKPKSCWATQNIICYQKTDNDSFKKTTTYKTLVCACCPMVMHEI